MNKQIYVISILLFLVFITPFSIKAQNLPTFDIPEPQCVSVPGIPCPDDKNIDISKLQKTQTQPVLGSKNNSSKTFEYLISNIGKLKLKLKNDYLDLRNKFFNFFDNLKKK